MADGRGQVVKRLYGESLYTRGRTTESGYASVEIERQGGRQVLVMTDWNGRKTTEVLV